MAKLPDRATAVSVIVVVATLFGLITIVAGTGVLLGINPGYKTFRPLLVFNTGMGFLYVLAGLSALRNISLATRLALLIFTANVLVLAAITYLYSTGYSVAPQSVGAMGFRSLLWMGLYLALITIGRKRNQN